MFKPRALTFASCQLLLSALVVPSTALAGVPTFSESVPYTSPADSPFFATQKVGVDYFLEDFERGVITVPGLSDSDIDTHISCCWWGVDSVDLDDGELDGQGWKGHSLANYVQQVINLQFDDAVLGGFPTEVGFVLTDAAPDAHQTPQALLTITVVDPLGNPGSATFAILGGSSSWTGGDRFYGVTWPDGIAHIQIAASPPTVYGLEIDHVQFNAPSRFVLWSRDMVNAGDNSDLVWHRPETGAVSVWLMNGFAKRGGAASQSTPTTYLQQGMGDFDGNGTADLLWRDSDTNIFHVWLMNGQNVVTASPVVGAGAVDTQWVCLGVGDTNGDGKADVVFRNSDTDAMNIWYMDGVTRTSGGAIVHLSDDTVVMLATNLNFVALGDFNGDGRDDILWREVGTDIIKGWLLNGRIMIKNKPIGNAGAINPDWVIGTVGDLDGDGRADIIWRNTVTAAVSGWLMMGLYRFAGGSVGSIPPAWSLSASADLNGDGMHDLIWTNAGTGQVSAWMMGGLTKLQGGSFGTVNNLDQWTLVNR